jgi:hypothetical protein
MPGVELMRVRDDPNAQAACLYVNGTADAAAAYEGCEQADLALHR